MKRSGEAHKSFVIRSIFVGRATIVVSNEEWSSQLSLLILSALAFFTLDPFHSSSVMEMFVLSFCISSSILFPHVFLGQTMSVMAQAVAYIRLLILLMLRCCPCLMLVRAMLVCFRVFLFWDWFSVPYGPLFTNFPFLLNEVFHFCNFLVLWGLLSCPIFLLLFVFQWDFQVWWRLCWTLWGIWLGLDLFAHLTLSWISRSSVRVSFCCLSIYRCWFAKLLASISGLESWFLLCQIL